ncbi:MAG: DUF6090 family protein [Flavobacteriaceae bacterium]|nr:DUF6090 family protein [Flavobacteriaceae bacterium]
MENRLSRYLLYALGEILLVVIGILIALQVNNLNEQEKNRDREQEILIDLKSAIESDLKLYRDVYQFRFNIKKEGLEFLKRAVYEQKDYPKDTLIKYVRKMQINILFRFDQGPYDALKAAGFELISNRTLRQKIINTYEVNLPAFTVFINEFAERSRGENQKYKNELLKEVVVEEDNGSLEIHSKIKADNFIEHPFFVPWLANEEDSYENYISRMGDVESFMIDLLNGVNYELEQ